MKQKNFKKSFHANYKTHIYTQIENFFHLICREEKLKINDRNEREGKVVEKLSEFC